MEELDTDLVQYSEQVFVRPAECAKTNHKEKALMAIYEAAFCLGIPFLPDACTHPITYAAQWGDLVLARAYITAGRCTGQLHYDRKDGYSVLIDVLNAETLRYELMQLCLKNDANADIILPSGESLYDAAASCGDDMRHLILSGGGGPAMPIPSAIHKTVNDMTAVWVNAESFETLIDSQDCEYCHEYANGFTLFSRKQKADVFLTAVKQQNKTVLNILLQRLGISATDAQMERFLYWAADHPEQLENCTPGSLLAF